MGRRLRLLVLAMTLSVAGLATLSSSATPPAAAAAPAASSTAHPRLLFSAQDVPALRARVASGGVPAQAWIRLKDRAEDHLLRVSPDVVRANVGIPLVLQGLEKPYTLQNEMPTYLIDLGMAYQISGDIRYGRRAIDLLSALGDAHWPYWCCQDLGVGDLLEGVGLGFDWTYQMMTPAERTKIVGDITRDDKLLLDRMLVNPTHPAARYPTSNWMGVTSGGAGLTALAIRGEPGAPKRIEDYIARAMKLTHTFFAAAVDANGAYNEGHTYGYYGMKNSVPFALAVKRAGRGNLIAGTGLPLMARWQTFEQLPGEAQNFVPLNDSGRPQFGAGMPSLHFAIAPGNGVAQWLWQRTVGPQGDDLYSPGTHLPSYALPSECTQQRFNLEPVALAACPIANLHDNVFAILFYRSPKETPEVDPARTGLSVWHRSRGLVDARTGFAKGAAETVSTFEAHRDGTAHFQYDVGNFTLYGEGGRFAVDPGTSCVACGNNDDMGFAIDHNVILVDGKKETQYRFLRYFFGTTVDGYLDAPTFTLTHADLRYAYNFESPYADRDHLFGRSPGRPVLVAIGDSLQRDKIPFERAKPDDHTYTWQMLTALDNNVSTSGSAFTVKAPNGATLVGRGAVDGKLTADPAFTTREIVYDQIAFDQGAHVVTTSTKPSQRFDQLTVLALTPAGQPVATTETLRVTGGNAVAVDWKGGRDGVVRRLKLSRTVTGTVATDGTMAKYTRGLGDTVLRTGTSLVGDGVAYITVTGKPATVTVSDTTATAVGPRANRYRVLAPQQLTATTVNGVKVLSCRTGTYVVFPCAVPQVTKGGSRTSPASTSLPRTGLAAPSPTVVAQRQPNAVLSSYPIGVGLGLLLLSILSAATVASRRRAR